MAVDTWVHDEFNRAMYNKASLLTTLVDEDAESIEFDFAGEFMPEFEGDADPEYYQLWRNGDVFERSDTLEIFAIKSLAYKKLEVGKQLIVEATLPDGRSGQVLYYSFLPQVDSDDREEYNQMITRTGANQQPMLLAYALSTEKLNFVMWLIDISFVTAAISVALIVRFLVKRAVSNGLKPLEEFTKSLKSISLADKNSEVSLSNKVIELLPIQDSINTFIHENRTLYQKEQQLSSDIAHELKTPISELISLTEVSIKFSDDKKLVETYKPEVLEISKRLENIVANILLFHRYSHETFEKNDVFDTCQVLSRLAGSNHRIDVAVNKDIKPITSNLFAFESIFSNLLKNADSYSPSKTTINVKIETVGFDQISIAIENSCLTPLTKEDLAFVFDPLWQKDNARTSTHNFGLGLSIVQTFTNALSGSIGATIDSDVVKFTVILPTQ
jgi:signal transduction histidine kinase